MAQQPIFRWEIPFLQSPWSFVDRWFQWLLKLKKAKK
jgi:hypothetical protein